MLIAALFVGKAGQKYVESNNKEGDPK